MSVDSMEMLHKIVAADKEARRRVSDARGELDSFDERLKALGQELEQSALRQAEREVAAAREEAGKASMQTLSALDRQREQAVAAMRARFSERKEEGVETLFRMVIGLED